MPQLNSQIQNKKQRKIWPWILGCFGIFIFVGSFAVNIFLFFALFTKDTASTSGGKITEAPQLNEILVEGKRDGLEKIAIITIDGEIMYQEDSWSSLTGSKNGAEFILRQIRQARDDQKIKAIILNIKSPGGSITASDDIYQEIVKTKKSGKKVIAFLNETAASGGYYVALPADNIMASPTTITGSIGVIAQSMNIKDLLEKYGVKFETIKSGKHKDIMSAYREMTPEERDILQAILNEYYAQFVDLVKKHRTAINQDKLEEITDGRVFTAKQALDLKLIDELGYEDDANNLAMELAGLREKNVIQYKEPFNWESFFAQAETNFSQYALIKNLLNTALFNNQRKILFQ